jgi:uncharacterized membrane protein YdjX (TVP38/TMEM64 family)
MLKKIAIPFLISATVIIITFLLFGDLEAFFINLLNNAAKHPGTYSFISFLVLASDIILPVPSSIVMYTNGFVLGLAGGSFISLVALMVGSVVGYYLGKFTLLGTKGKSDQKADQVLSRYGVASVLISRGIPIISESISIVCGYNRMPFKTYFILNLVGYIPLCLLYAFCGSVGYNQDTFLISFGCSLLISAAFWLVGKKFLKNQLTITEQINE